jgi:hypothetical protein
LAALYREAKLASKPPMRFFNAPLAPFCRTSYLSLWLF